MTNFWNNKEKKKKAIESAKNSLRDIIPVKNELENIKEGEKNFEDLLDDAKFQATLEEKLGYEPSNKEKKKILNEALDELKK